MSIFEKEQKINESPGVVEEKTTFHPGIQAAITMSNEKAGKLKDIVSDKPTEKQKKNGTVKIFTKYSGEVQTSK